LCGLSNPDELERQVAMREDFLSSLWMPFKFGGELRPQKGEFVFKNEDFHFRKDIYTGKKSLKLHYYYKVVSKETGEETKER
jgi:hypothetical protein